MAQRYGAIPGSPDAGHVAALKQLWHLAYREASTLAFADAFRAIMLAFIVATLLVPLLRQVAPRSRQHRADILAGPLKPPREGDDNDNASPIAPR